MGGEVDDFKQWQTLSYLNPSQESDTELESAKTEQIIEPPNLKRGADEVDTKTDSLIVEAEQIIEGSGEWSFHMIEWKKLVYLQPNHVIVSRPTNYHLLHPKPYVMWHHNQRQESLRWWEPEMIDYLIAICFVSSGHCPTSAWWCHVTSKVIWNHRRYHWR